MNAEIITIDNLYESLEEAIKEQERHKVDDKIKEVVYHLRVAFNSSYDAYRSKVNLKSRSSDTKDFFNYISKRSKDSIESIFNFVPLPHRGWITYFKLCYSDTEKEIYCCYHLNDGAFLDKRSMSYWFRSKKSVDCENTAGEAQVNTNPVPVR